MKHGHSLYVFLHSPLLNDSVLSSVESKDLRFPCRRMFSARQDLQNAHALSSIVRTRLFTPVPDVETGPECGHLDVIVKTGPTKGAGPWASNSPVIT